MSSFLYRLGRLCYRHRWRVLLIWCGVLLLVGLGALALGKDFEDRFNLPGTSSQEALDQLSRTFPEVSGTSAQVILVAPDGRSVREPRIRSAITDAVERYGRIDQVDTVKSPYDPMISGAIAADDSAAVITVQLTVLRGAVASSTTDAINTITADLQDAVPGSTVSAGGDAYAVNGVSLSSTEVISVVVALVVLVLTLGSVIAAGMPLLSALLGVVVAMAGVFAATEMVAINSSTPVLVMMLGLAVGIDYALFIISRHREQLRTGMEPEESAARAVATAGSAVVFAGSTVMIAMAGLTVAGIPFLGHMGIAASVGVGVAVCVALTLLPAMLGLAGERLRPEPKRQRRAPREVRKPDPTQPRGFFGGWVRLATAWPLVTVVLIIAGLGALALPARGLELALPDNGTAEKGTPARVTYDLISEHYGQGYNSPLIVTADIVASDDPLGVMAELKHEISTLLGVAGISLTTTNQDADTGIVQVVPSSSSESEQTKGLVHQIRELAPGFEAEHGTAIAVTGSTAIQIDITDRLGRASLPYGILVAGLSLLLLTMVFRSVVVYPLKASIGYLLSVGASFGVVALVFEHGFLAGPLNVDHQGPVLSFLPMVLMGSLFGLAMDYEVFLVSRIREAYVHTRDAQGAIRTGFVSSARVVTAAAVIMFTVFVAFVPDGDPMIKAIAVGLATGVFVDAFVVRMTLVPAVLALLGRAAWHLPAWIDKRLPSFDVEGAQLTRLVELTDWPTPDSDHLIYAEGVTAGTDDWVLLDRTDVSLRPGEVLVVDGLSGAARSGLLWLLSGRMKPRTGRIKTVGMVLPQQAGSVRRRTQLIDLATTDDQIAAFTAARDGSARVVFIDHVERLGSSSEHAALAELINVCTNSGRGLVLATDRPAALRPLLPNGFRHLALRPPERIGRLGTETGSGPDQRVLQRAKETP